jgi:hypothetical protein
VGEGNIIADNKLTQITDTAIVDTNINNTSLPHSREESKKYDYDIIMVIMFIVLLLFLTLLIIKYSTSQKNKRVLQSANSIQYY